MDRPVPPSDTSTSAQRCKGWPLLFLAVLFFFPISNEIHRKFIEKAILGL